MRANSSTARDALAPYLSAPTRRVAALMAEIEEAEHGDTGRVREWMSRAVRASPDPVWTADGVVSERWLPVTPNGRLDGFEWKLPLAELGVSRPVIEVPAPPPAPSQSRRRRWRRRSLRRACARRKNLPIGRQVKMAKPVEPVIPLVHAPDDPGPESCSMSIRCRNPRRRPPPTPGSASGACSGRAC